MIKGSEKPVNMESVGLEIFSLAKRLVGVWFSNLGIWICGMTPRDGRLGTKEGDASLKLPQRVYAILY